MTEEEVINTAVNRAIEKMLLILPETIGNLMASHAALHKINKKFYDDYPEFKDKKDIVASVVEMVEGKNPLEKYEEILKKAIPEIRSRIKIVGSLDMKNVTTSPDRNFKSLSISNVSNNGEI